MWRNRYDDLWLYPMPGWFVRVCNKTIGAYVLDLIVLSEVIGLVLFVVAVGAGIRWMQIVGYILIAPAPMLIVMMIITAQYRQRRQRRSDHSGGSTSE